MKYLKQFSIILLIALAGEALSFLLPLPVPASIYGILLLFVLLCTGLLHVSAIKEVSSFLVAVMPVMFIPAAAGLMDSFALLLPALAAIIVVMAVSTVAVMAASGRAAQAVIERNEKRKGRD